MNKYIKWLMLTIITVLITIAFTKVFVDYSEYKFLSKLNENETYIRFEFFIDDRIDEEETIRVFNEYLIENNLAVHAFDYESKDLVYYNPTSNEEFESVLEEYECNYDCFGLKELELSDLTVNKAFFIYGNKEFTNDIENHIPSALRLDTEEYQVTDNSYFIAEYQIYFVIVLLLIFSLILTYYLDFLKTIEKLILHSIYGYDFLDFFKQFCKKNVLLTYGYVVSSSVVFIFFMQRTIDSVIAILLLHLLIITTVLVILLALAFLVYKNIASNVKYNVVNFSIISSSVIFCTFIIMCISLLTTFTNNLVFYNASSTSYEFLSDYYQVEFNQNIELEKQLAIGEDLVNNYDGEFVFFIDNNMRELPDEISEEEFYKFVPKTNVLQVDSHFLSRNPQIKNLDGSEIVITNQEKGYVLVGDKGLDISYYEGLDFYEIIYVEDDGAKYNTFSPLTPHTTLDESVIEIWFDPPLDSNVNIHASSLEEAIDIFKEVYVSNGVEIEPKVYSAGDSQFVDSGYTKLMSSLIAIIIASICLGVVSSFYALLIFKKYNRKIMLTHIYGQGKLRMLFKEVAVVYLLSILILILWFNIGLTEIIIIVVLMIILILVMYYQFRKLITKSIVSFVKGEM